MRFKYRRINLFHPFSRKKYILRPIIPISLSTKSASIRYETLIDSGSDFNIFPTEIAEKLGIDLKNKRRIHFSGVEDILIEGFIATVFLGINHKNHKTNIVFADLQSAAGILGQNGFFDIFSVKFDLTKEGIEIKIK